MGDSAIEWTQRVWNPTTGCDKVSPGCDRCYALGLAKRWKAAGQPKYQNDGDPRTSGPGFGVTMHPDLIDLPVRWRRGYRIFVNSMSDLFHPKVTDDFIAQAMAVMVATPRHSYQVLTKRAPRMAALTTSPAFWQTVSGHLGRLWRTAPPAPLTAVPAWIWMGVSVEDQDQADRRIPHLLRAAAHTRWLSIEPLLGPVDLTADEAWFHGPADCQCATTACPSLDWIVVGGETGPGARTMHPTWARSLRDQAVEAGVPFFFKQWGDYAYPPIFDAPTFAGGRAYQHPRGGTHAAVIRRPGPSGTMRTAVVSPLQVGDETRGGAVMLDDDTIAIRVGKKLAGRVLDGRTWDEYPTVGVGA